MSRSETAGFAAAGGVELKGSSELYGNARRYAPLDVDTLKVRIVDSSKTVLYDEAEVTINVIDEDDGPKIVIPPDPGNDTTKRILVLKNGKQRGVKENNPKDALAGKVSAT